MGHDESTFEGRTLDDAVKKGLAALGRSRAEVMITILEEGSGGFLGLGARPYKVRIMARPGGAIREPEAEREGERGRSRGRGRGRGERERPGGGREWRGGERERGGERRRMEAGVAAPRGRAEERAPQARVKTSEVERVSPELDTEAGRRRRRRGRRGGRGRRGELGPDAPVQEPARALAGGEEREHDVEARRAEIDERRRMDERAREDEAPVRTRLGAEAIDVGPAKSPEELAAAGRQLTEELFSAMGFEATVTAEAQEDHVDVAARVTSGEDLLIGEKGEVRQALQHLLNRMLNRGEGSRYHLQLEINEFWKHREDELRELAQRLAEEALETGSETVTEYLNSQERRIVHTTLRDDARVKTYALGTGLIKRVAVAPADYPQGAQSGE